MISSVAVFKLCWNFVKSKGNLMFSGKTMLKISIERYARSRRIPPYIRDKILVLKKQLSRFIQGIYGNHRERMIHAVSLLEPCNCFLLSFAFSPCSCSRLEGGGCNKKTPPNYMYSPPYAPPYCLGVKNSLAWIIQMLGVKSAACSHSRPLLGVESVAHLLATHEMFEHTSVKPGLVKRSTIK